MLLGLLIVHLRKKNNNNLNVHSKNGLGDYL